MKPTLNLLFLPLLAGAATAATISVGSPDATPSLARCLPLTCSFDYGVAEYQQVYTSTAFPSPFSITGVSFTRDTATGTSSEPATFDIFFSTTSKGVGGLDTNLGMNDGPDRQLFGSFSIATPVSDTLTFTGTPFNYDPSQGNLLLEIVFNSTAYNNASLSYFMYTTPDGLTSRAWTGGGGGFAQTPGLYTTFNDTPSTLPSSNAPEPSTMGLLGAGGLAAFAALRKRATV